MATTNSDGFELDILPYETKQRLIKDTESKRRDPFAEDAGPRYFKAVLYGNPGCGKTVLAGRLALPDEKILFIDAEDSASVIRSHPEWFKGRVAIDPFNGWLETAFLLDKVVHDGIYKTVVIDSLQSAFRMEMTSIVTSRASRAKDGVGNPNKDQYQIEEYGIYLNRLSSFIGSALRKPLNIIISGHVNEPSDIQIKNGQKKRITGSDNQIQAITSLIGNIFYVQLIEGGPNKMEIGIQTREGKDSAAFARTRINELPTAMPGEKFIDAIHKWRQGKPID
jgi:AAA domain-containing protein